MTRTPLLGLSLTDLQTLLEPFKAPTFVAKQIAHWLYQKKVTDIDSMTNIPLSLRERLNESYEVGRIAFQNVQTSSDRTRKYVFPTLAQGAIEAAYIPSRERHTLCVSSQMGCKMGCSFCATGKQGFQHHLSTQEILNQVLSIEESDTLSNLVFMGMGEPFDNVEALMRTLEIICAPWGMAWSPRRIQVSTIGIIPGMIRFIEGCECHLALSLHSPFDYERAKLMPAQNKYPLKEIMRVLRNYDWAHQRRLSFEYIVFEDINDTHRHMDELSKMLKGLHCRVNLIRFHEHPACDFKPSSLERLEVFRDYLNDHGIICTIRQSRGEDISAACGLLSTQESVHKS